MKKTLALIIVVSCLIVAAGCAGNAETSDTASVSQGIASQDAQLLDAAAGSSSLEHIGEDAAKEAALEHSGLTESEVTYIKAKLDYDDGKWVYDIEFYHSNTEYDYELDASTGEIVSYDFDIEDYVITSRAPIQDTDGTYIGLGEAKTIALSKANLTEEQITYTEASFQYDDGMEVYQIDFVSDGIEYEFEINATTGDIIEYGVESQYD